VPLAVLSLFQRWRRAAGVERQQLKWLAYASLMLVLLVTVGMGASLLQIPGRDLFIIPLSMVVVLFLPASLGIAILRYRLYDIDRIIRRTLVYGVVTGVLTAAYFGAVVLLQALFVRLTGQQSALAVVASTLGIAALFGPLRARVQEQVDRRFFRTTYDARLVLEGFAMRARDETDLDALAADLLATVEEALRPEQATLWLAKEGRR
jgi:hypothetical protein